MLTEFLDGLLAHFTRAWLANLEKDVTSASMDLLEFRAGHLPPEERS